MKTKKLIIGIALIIFSVVLAYGTTYAYEYFEGNKGREFITAMFGFFIVMGLMISGIVCIIDYYES
jgi:ABC-type spermidine/putrescine transport system permease subunit II